MEYLFDRKVLAGCGLVVSVLVLVLRLVVSKDRSLSFSAFTSTFLSGMLLPIGFGLIAVALVAEQSTLQARLGEIRQYLPIAGLAMIWVAFKSLWQILHPDNRNGDGPQSPG